MSVSTITIACIARDEVKAVRVLDELKSAGVVGERISVLLPERAVVGGFEPAAQTACFSIFGSAQGRGGLLAGALDNLSNVTAFTRASLGRVIGAGPVMAALCAQPKSANSQSFAAELQCVGLGPEEAERFERSLASGSVLVAASCLGPKEATRIESVLVNAGAHDVTRCAQDRSSQQPVETFHSQDAS